MSHSPTRLWDKGLPLDALIHRFTVGEDPAWDAYLVEWDCRGSAAHARTLARAGLLTDAELAALLGGLGEILADVRAGRFAIPPELEDAHTAIEAFLTQRCGEAGARLPAGRSRNDQVATALRLFMRHHTLGWLNLLDGWVATLVQRIARDGDIPMPGYTHLQAAMPASVGLWLHAHAEAALEQLHAALDLLRRLDACPLGTGAGFGVPLPLDRAYTAALLGFRRVQRSPLDVQNSRARSAKYFVRVAADIAAMLEKVACDLLLFTTAEFGFFSLPVEMTTGSSLMPQKRNPDVLELLRAHGARASARVAEVEALGAKLPSSYHRDVQLTKPPTIRAALDTADVLRIATQVVEGFEIHQDRLVAAMKPELYATHAALALVRDGRPFREAYRQIAADLAAGRFDEHAAAPWRAEAGRTAPDVVQELQAEAAEVRQQAADWRHRVRAADDELWAGVEAGDR
jgi:argininosuccinate lyase